MTHNFMRNLFFDPQLLTPATHPTSHSASGVLQLVEGKIQGCDAIAAQLLGSSVEALLGSTLFNSSRQITHLDGSPLSCEAAIDGNSRREIRLGVNQPDGKRIWLHLALTPLFQATPTHTVIATLTPIIPSQSFSEQQPQFQSLMQQIAATVPGMLYVYDLIEQRNVYVNRQVGEILGYTPEQIEQMGDRVLALLIHPADLARLSDHQSRFETAIDSQVLEFEYRMRRADGEWCWLLSKETIFSRTDTGSPQQILGVAQDITSLKQREVERQQAEATLRESEARFRCMSELLPQIFWTTASDGSLDYFSPRWEEYIGSDQFQMVGWDWRPIIHPDDFQLTADRWTGAFQAGQFYECEHRLCRYDGEYRWHLSRAMPLKDETDQVIKWYGTAIDIHDLKQTTAALHQSNAILNTISTSTPTLIYVKDRAGRMLVINPAVVALIGKPPEEIIGKTALEFVKPLSEAEKVMTNDRVVMETGEPQQFEEIVESAEGRRVFLSVKAPYRDEQGRINGIIGISSDITDRKQAELEREQLLTLERQYANQLQGLTAASNAINSALSVEEVLQTITKQAAVIVGTHQSVTSVIIEQNWAQAITAIYLSEKYAQWQDYKAEPDGTGIYAFVCHLNRPMRMTQAELEAHPQWKGFGKEARHHPPLRGWLAAPLVGRKGQNIGLIQLSDKFDGDFTEADEAILVQLAQLAAIAVENARLYEAEQRARSIAEASREEAQAANRIKDEFLAVLSHELRTPLNPILGWLKLLQSGRLDAEKSKEALATIERNARLQSQLVEDLLDISRIMRGKLTLNKSSVNLKAVVGAAIETVRLATEAKAIQVHAMLNSDPKVIGDAARLQQVIWNLLSNAVKFTPVGGQIWVQLSQVGDQAHIQVSDNGKGINPDFLPYVFDYFRQEDSSTTRKFGGLGLGLAIVRQIVELHGGTVTVDSQGEGQGAIFTVRLPLQDNLGSIRKARPVSALPSQANSQLLRDIRILVVDDDPDTLYFHTVALEAAGATVIGAGSAAEAMYRLSQSLPDLLLSDIGMPETNGYVLMQQIKAFGIAKDKPIRAIALSAYASPEDQRRALEAGFQLHLAKPIDPDCLIQTIAALLDRTDSANPKF